jgi:hypothetical protein
MNFKYFATILVFLFYGSLVLCAPTNPADEASGKAIHVGTDELKKNLAHYTALAAKHQVIVHGKDGKVWVLQPKR